jgi:phosphatidylserine/phosphatidylglycerophosphate/cardiolipin synthase-like enzyme
VYPFAPPGEFGIHHAYTRALRQAQRLIYLENQYLWSPDIVDALIAAMNTQHAEPFRIVIVLPARAYDGKWDNDQHVARLREVDAGRGMVSVYCPYTSGPTIGVHAFAYRPIYVHAKVAIIDDEWLTVGSANLNNRGLITDSEINAVVRDPELARNLRIALWAEHLALPREQVAQADPIDLVDHQWAGRAAENAQIIRRADRPLVCAAHRYETGHMPGARLLEEAEALTFEY